MRTAYKILIGKQEGKIPLGKSRHRQEYNIKIDLRDKGRKIVFWIRLARVKEEWRALVITELNIRPT
jgi:hypothetical protein